MPKVLTRFLVAIAIVVPVGMAMFAAPATADCVGPTITVEPGEISPGTPVGVRGEWFGDNCYDAGDPPPGQGIFGVPLAGIEIVIIQDDAETVVASGNAEENYDFEVEFLVPPSVVDGPLTIEARYARDATAFVQPDTPFTVVGATPDGSTPNVVTFGPAESTSGGAVVPSELSERSLTGSYIVVALAVAAVVALFVAQFVRGRRAGD